MSALSVKVPDLSRILQRRRWNRRSYKAILPMKPFPYIIRRGNRKAELLTFDPATGFWGLGERRQIYYAIRGASRGRHRPGNLRGNRGSSEVAERKIVAWSRFQKPGNWSHAPGARGHYISGLCSGGMPSGGWHHARPRFAFELSFTGRRRNQCFRGIAHPARSICEHTALPFPQRSPALGPDGDGSGHRA